MGSKHVSQIFWLTACLYLCPAAPAAQLVAFKCFGGIVNLDPIGARHALALAVIAARKVCCLHF